MSSVQDRHAHLLEAERFYKLSLTALRTGKNLQFDSSCFALMLGLVANVGHVFSHLFKVNEAMACQYRMEEFLDAGAFSALSEAEADFFYSILVDSSSPFFSMAPAA